MRKLIFVFVLAGSVCAIASAQTALLPDRFGAWEAAGPSKITSGSKVYEGRPNAEDGRLREAGLLSLERRTYKSGGEELQLNLYKLKDTSGAYELYTQAIAPDMASGNLADESAFRSTDGVILIGNLVVATSPVGHGLKTASLAELVPALKSKADTTPYPPLRTYLPTTWRVFGTEKYAQGPVGFGYAMDTLGQGAYRDLSKEAGFDTGAEAILAKYQGQHGSGTLLLLQYPTPQIAENHLHHLEQALPAAAKQAGVTVERKASLLSLVFAPTSAIHARAIRDEVNYETEVTWNEPSTTATDPPLVYVMFKIFVFTSLFLVFATVVGIFFGGLRILIKHWLPGKVFDRPQDIEVLQLGLSGKKIDPTDMY